MDEWDLHRNLIRLHPVDSNWLDTFRILASSLLDFGVSFFFSSCGDPVSGVGLFPSRLLKQIVRELVCFHKLVSKGHGGTSLLVHPYPVSSSLELKRQADVHVRLDFLTSSCFSAWSPNSRFANRFRVFETSGDGNGMTTGTFPHARSSDDRPHGGAPVTTKDFKVGLIKIFSLGQGVSASSKNKIIATEFIG